MEIDKKLFEIINSYELPPIVTELAIYGHGYRHVEVAFFLFCLVLAGVVLGSPKRGIKAAVAIFIAAMSTFFGAKYLQTLILRPFPYLNGEGSVQLRVEPLISLSAAPVISITVTSAVVMALIYYFPRYTGLFIVGILIYTVLPVHLGVAYPSDAFGSLALGTVFSYILMNSLGRKTYFKRF